MLKIGHRGAAGHAPENTQASFRKAFLLGADAVEFDVHLCKSGEPVVIHDETVDRTTDGHGAVAALPLSELKTLDAGKGERIPTLEEALDTCLTFGGAFIEVKKADAALSRPRNSSHESRGRKDTSLVNECHVYPGKDESYFRDMTLAAAELASRYRREGARGIFMISFERETLEIVRGVDSGLSIGLSIDALNESELKNTLDALCPEAVNPRWDLLTGELVAILRARGIKIFPWTVNAPEDIATVKALGADGIMSDFPDRL